MKQIFLITFLFISCISYGQQKEDKNDFFLAETYYREGEYEKATQIYKKLYDKSAFNTTYLNRLISCYQQTEKFLIAENLLKEKIKLLLSNPKIRKTIGDDGKNESKKYSWKQIVHNLEKVYKTILNKAERF